MKLHIHRVYLDKYGYAGNGQYFGIGEKVWYYQFEDTDTRIGAWGNVRAPSKLDAKIAILKKYKLI